MMGWFYHEYKPFQTINDGLFYAGIWTSYLEHKRDRPFMDRWTIANDGLSLEND
jgi:hypothetical protein